MKKKASFPFLLLLFLFQPAHAQQVIEPDSTHRLDTVLVTAFGQNRPLLSANASIALLSRNQATLGNASSLLSGFNSLAGVRMEERSPGSYRLNIRGSSLRSPFGVRNVKVYWNDIPFTDPGGNTYFNAFALNNFSSAEVYKGPASSLYGAGTGGLILLHSIDRSWQPGLSLQYETGSYGLQNILGSWNFGSAGNEQVLSYAHTQSDGYRDHTHSRKDNASFVSRHRINERQELSTAVLFSNLYYQTPGGLNLKEYNNNPRQARPAAGPYPSAAEAQAAIYQKNLLAGLTHTYQFNDHFSNSSTVYSAFAQIRNPTFRNYERRNEPHYGARSSFSYSGGGENWKGQLLAGLEWQQGYFNSQVSQNLNGSPDTLQTDDDVRYNNLSVFLQADFTLAEKTIITAGLSSSRSDVRFTRLNEYPVQEQSRSYRNEWSPRISLLRRLGSGSAVYATVARGYSPPSISELLPSTGVISTFLQAEEGMNYELGGRFGLLKNQLRGELNLFYFRLANALVVRKDSSNADYYVNAGHTRQQGAELSLSYQHFFARAGSFWQSLSVRTAQSYYYFVYGDYQKGSTRYDGNYLPSVPGYTLSVVASLQSRPGLFLQATCYAASKIYLTDDNSVSAPAYQVLGARLGWRFHSPKSGWQVYGGADNLLNQAYSLGNDINAAAGRYYNAAPGRNYYIGLRWDFKQNK